MSDLPRGHAGGEILLEALQERAIPHSVLLAGDLLRLHRSVRQAQPRERRDAPRSVGAGRAAAAAAHGTYRQRVLRQKAHKVWRRCEVLGIVEQRASSGAPGGRINPLPIVPGANQQVVPRETLRLETEARRARPLPRAIPHRRSAPPRGWNAQGRSGILSMDGKICRARTCLCHVRLRSLSLSRHGRTQEVHEGGQEVAEEGQGCGGRERAPRDGILHREVPP
mmetsp:Transcript_32640/g.97481  ORF Transcript_32640/g.97481 Transcript_32640/m.97481 type:complete len:224 (-) Transcript_32640:716-1387(-)